MQTITKDSNIAKLIEEHPETAEVLMDYGLHCVGCIASSYDSVEQGAKVHGLSDGDIDNMLNEINDKILV